jgi:hypothetical protein
MNILDDRFAWKGVKVFDIIWTWICMDLWSFQEMKKKTISNNSEFQLQTHSLLAFKLIYIYEFKHVHKDL